MAINDNPCATPIDDRNSDPHSFSPDSAPLGFPKPLTLAATGLVFAIVIVATIAMVLFSEKWAVTPIFALALIPCQLAWLYFTRKRTQQYQETWSPGTRGMLHSVWVLNVLLLGINSIFAFFIAAGWVASN